MKKFLSLVLALVMTMSLVTISAGATEYKDLTDKDEIQYEEAVAVLNRIGIITGYEDGSFRPETELTRGAAAKIIVSLMIGPEAAAALPNDVSPYPDVPAGHTFAGVIGYCKTAGYISGYGDGTFKPANSLTGYAFAKMLLGAVGYKSDLEGFTGTGWTMNVARLGNAAGLFNRLSFQGSDAVNREEACQLALNTLKATMVEYTGGFTITSGDAAIVGDKTRTYVTSNQAYAKNIDNRKAGSEGNAKDEHYTVEFGEEHFKDLRLNDEHVDARDSFGRPSNEWSYKKVTIGTFPIAADFVFDHQMAHVDKTDAVKNRATGLSSYDLKKDDVNVYTSFWINGVKYDLNNDGEWLSNCPDTFNGDDIAAGKSAKIANINDLTDNGTIVEVYVSEDDADFISDVVVVQTQLMEVRRVGSDYVSLQRESDDDPDDINNNAYNMKPIDVTVDDVNAEDNAYSVLSELKEGDVVAVIPVAQDSDPANNTRYDVSEAYVPETVKGALTAVETYGTLTSQDKDPVNVTVGGSAYPVALWSRDLKNIDGDAVKMTRKDVTLYLDKNGNALKAEDVGSTDGWMVIGRYYEDVVDRHLVTMVEGWDTSGEKLELNIGNFRYNYTGSTYRKGFAPGDLVRYESTTTGNAEWVISVDQGKNHVVPVDIDAVDAYTNDRIEKSDVRIPLLTNHGTATYNNHENVYVDSTGIKFVFVTYESDGSGEVESVEIKKGVQEVTMDELKDFYDRSTKGDDAGKADNDDSCYTHAQAGYTTSGDGWDPNQVKVVVVKSESNDAEATNLMYIRDQVGGAEKLSDGTMLYHYTVVMLGPDGYFNDEVRIASDDNVRENTFVSYSQKEIESYSGSETCYDLRDHSNYYGRVASTAQANVFQMVNADKGFIRLSDVARVKGSTGTAPDLEVMKDNRGGTVSDLGGDKGVIRIYNAKFADLRSQADKRETREISSYKDLKWLISEADASVRLDKDGDGYLTDPNTDGVTTEQTLQLQIIVNDKVGNGNFREAALVVVTEVENANAQIPASTDASLTLKINDEPVSFTKVDDVTYTAEFTYEVADEGSSKSIEATTDAKATATVSGTAAPSLTITAGAGTGTVTLDDTETIVIAVRAENGTTITYTVTLKAVDSTVFNWSGLNDEMVAALNTLEDQSLSDISDLVFVDDGTAATMEEQAEEALKHLGVNVTAGSVELLNSGDIAYTYTTPGGNTLSTTFTPNIDLIVVTVGTTKTYLDVSGGAKNLDDLTALTIGCVRETKVNGDVVDHKNEIANLSSVAVNAGSTYVDAAFRVYAEDNVSVTGFDVSFAKADGTEITLTDGTSIVDVGEEITVTLTATADVTVAATPMTNAAKITLGDAGTVVLGASNTVALAGVVASNTAGVLTFVNTANTPIIATGDTFSITLAAIEAPAAGDIEFAPTVEYTAATN
nr:S-layer homology domain-containing protein [uncultured Oscillibacter sp.]